ncbi:MAG: hypothetical protein JXA10_08025 [Anaerolineae bacterium]|nr:hypothetical protein [Anaerolineae bacterium]
MYSCDPDLELDGFTALSLVSSLNVANYFDFLVAHHLDQIESDGWYPVQDVLNVFNDIEKREGGMFDLVSVGMAVVTVKPFPPDKRPTLPQFLMIYNERYRQSHRHGDPGQIDAQQVEENNFVLKTQVPYPDDMMFGLFYGYVRELCPAGKPFTVKYAENHLRKDQGGDSTIFHIEWDK